MSATRPAPRRGEIWLADFDPVVGHEQGGQRPALVLSTDRFNAGRSQMIALLPLTTRDRGVLTHIKIEPPEGGILRPSVILCDQLRILSQQRLEKRVGQITPRSLRSVEAAVRKILGLSA